MILQLKSDYRRKSIKYSSLLTTIACLLLVLTQIDTGKFATGQFATGQTVDAEISQQDLDDLKARLQQIIDREIQQKQIPAFSIAVVVDKKLAFSSGHGFLDAEKSRPATGDSVYRVGSISKLLTDVALMKLVQQQKIDIDAPVQNYLPEFGNADQESSGQITLRQLTQHRAGIVRESPVGNYFDDSEPTLQQTIASLKSTPQIYPVGSRTKYSNAGVAAVGLAVEKVAGVDHPSFVKEQILQPLEMQDTSFTKTESTHSKLATGWMIGYDRPLFLAPDFMLGTGPAGNLYSSMEDLARFSCFMMGSEDHPVLDVDRRQAMMRAGKSPDGKDLPYGIGFRVSQFQGHQRVGHGGAVYGYSTQLEILPTEGMAVAASASLDGSNSVIMRICDFTLSSLLALKNQQPLPTYDTTTTVDRNRAQQLAGYFQSTSDPDRRLVIDWIGDRVLLWQGTFQNEIRSLESNGKLVIDDVFRFGDKVELARSKQYGEHVIVGNQTYSRLPDEAPKTAASEFNDLIGEYGWDHNTMYVLERHGKLYALIEWFYYYPLTKIGDDHYAFPDYGLYHGEDIQFQRDSEGKIKSALTAQVDFPRREVGTKNGETFKIQRQLPEEELRRLASEAKPPQELGDFKETDLVELVALDPSIELDIRYATTNNFMDTVFYSEPRAFAQRPAAQAAAKINQQLQHRKLRLLIHDAYRPWTVTKMFWDATPDSMKDFVANPASGSRHNRGCALDLTLYDTRTDKPIKMVSGYDEFSQRSYPLYPGGTERQRWYRGFLRRTMESNGFQVYEFEWWHFDFDGWESYRIGNQSFDQIK